MIRPDKATTKIRVVCDASTKPRKDSPSLNESEQIIYVSSNRRMKQINELAVKPTLKPRHRNADLPSSQQ